MNQLKKTLAAAALVGSLAIAPMAFAQTYNTGTGNTNGTSSTTPSTNTNGTTNTTNGTSNTSTNNGTTNGSSTTTNGTTSTGSTSQTPTGGVRAGAGGIANTAVELVFILSAVGAGIGGIVLARKQSEA